MKKRVLKIAGFILIVFAVAIQFIPINKINPPVNDSLNLVSTETISPEAQNLLKNACYDCHSNESNYPWYSNVAPISFVVENHIAEGREELNFSEYQSYTAQKKDRKLEEVIEALREGWMPLNEYVWLHGEADLTKDQRTILAQEFTAIREKLAYKK